MVMSILTLVLMPGRFHIEISAVMPIIYAFIIHVILSGVSIGRDVITSLQMTAYE